MSLLKGESFYKNIHKLKNWIVSVCASLLQSGRCDKKEWEHSVTEVFFLLFHLSNRISFHPYVKKTTFHERRPREGDINVQFFTQKHKTEVLKPFITRLLIKKLGNMITILPLFIAESNLFMMNFITKSFTRENCSDNER